MSKWHDFVLEHAKFPFPQPSELERSIGATGTISLIEGVGLLRPEWKATTDIEKPVMETTPSTVFEFGVKTPVIGYPSNLFCRSLVAFGTFTNFLVP